MDRFKAALQASEWDKALACCSLKVKEAAHEYDAPQEFLLDSVPVDLLASLENYPIGTTKGKPGELTFYGSFVDLMKMKNGPTIQWEWSLEKTGDSLWVVNFDPVPLRKWIAQKALAQQKRVESRRARFKAIKPSLDRLKTKLTPLNEKYVVGKPMQFRLELTNNGPIDLSYDDQQVDVNNPLIVTRENGEKVKYSGRGCQTAGAYRPIRSGQTIVLFDKLDVAKAYEINKPGHYRVQFKGKGLAFGDFPKEVIGNEAIMPSIEIWDASPYAASNTVEFDVQK